MNYAIIENEELSFLSLRKQVEDLRPDYRLAFHAETVEDAVALLSAAQDLDLVFMDIELDDGDCFDIFQRINPTVPVIFTTAYDQYCIQAFKVNSVDYLLKPIADSDLQAAIEKFERNRATSASSLPDIEQLLSALRQGKPTYNRILITSGDTYQYEEIADIAFFMAEDKYVVAYLKNGRQRVTNFSSLGELLPILNEHDFFPISRNIIASIGSVEKVSKYFKGRLAVTVRAGGAAKEVVVTAARRQDFLRWYGFGSV